jgi:hypothetical protein
MKRLSAESGEYGITQRRYAKSLRSASAQEARMWDHKPPLKFTPLW